ncbi:MAG: hypothetical protein OXH37_05125, partial [Gammaproteobacteria bacterium]|nr:hypothetical protein [Gammaproteobacteria bacterium]
GLAAAALAADTLILPADGPSTPLQRLVSAPRFPLDWPNGLPSGNSGNPNILGLDRHRTHHMAVSERMQPNFDTIAGWFYELDSGH